jgi:hypothetical protein
LQCIPNVTTTAPVWRWDAHNAMAALKALQVIGMVGCSGDMVVGL